MNLSVILLGGAGVAYFLTQTEKGEPFQKLLRWLPGFHFQGVFDCAFCSGFWSGLYIRFALCVLSVLSGELYVTSPLMGGTYAFVESSLYGMATGLVAITAVKIHDLADAALHSASMLTSFIPAEDTNIVDDNAQSAHHIGTGRAEHGAEILVPTNGYSGDEDDGHPE